MGKILSRNLTGFLHATSRQNTRVDKEISPSGSRGNLSGFSVGAIITNTASAVCQCGVRGVLEFETQKRE